MQSTSSPSFLSRVAPIHTLHIRRGASCMVAGIFLFTSIIGCQSHNIRSQAQGGSGAPLGHGLTTATLTDASFGGMPATRVTVPAGWHVQGQATVGTCPDLPYSSWTAVSPDGQSQINVLPTFGWQWSQRMRRGNPCIPLAETLTAADFLQKFAARVQGMRVLGPMPVDETFRSREEKWSNAMNSSHAAPLKFRAHSTGTVAALRAFDAKGHETRLRGWVECEVGPFGNKCFAKVDIVSAPKGRLNALVTLVDRRDLIEVKPIPQYQAALMDRMTRRNQEQGRQMMADGRRESDAASQMLSNAARSNMETSRANHQAFMGQMQQRQANHEAFLGQMQRGTDSSMRATQNSMNARSTAASDMQDYSLDQQTVSGANGTYKTSSQYSNVWSNPNGPALSNGRTFGSTNNAADPNSATDNGWTKDTRVHGNGQPY